MVNIPIHLPIMANHQKIRAAKRTVLKQERSLPHALRRAYHLAMGLVCFALYAWVVDRRQACWLVAGIGGPFLLFDILRLQSSRLKKFALQHFSQLMRRNELLGLSGNSFFIVGIFTVTLLFSKPIALLSILFLAVGDPVAAFVGTRYGRRKIWGRKTLEGAIANFCVSFLVSGWFAAGYLALSWERSLLLAMIGGVISTVSELVPAPVDDNLSVPVLAALLLSVVHFVWPLYY